MLPSGRPVTPGRRRSGAKAPLRARCRAKPGSGRVGFAHPPPRRRRIWPPVVPAGRTPWGGGGRARSALKARGRGLMPRAPRFCLAGQAAPPKGRKKPGPTLRPGGVIGWEKGASKGWRSPGQSPGPWPTGPGGTARLAAGSYPQTTSPVVARISPPAQGLVMPGSSSGGRSGAGRFPGCAPARPGSGAGRNPGRRAASRCLRR